MEHILGRIADADRYVGLHPGFAAAFEFLRRPDLAALPLGDYVLDATPDAKGRPLVKAMVQEAPLRPAVGDVQHAEAHGEYIDIQSPLSGPETFGLATIAADDPDYAFDAVRDVGFKDVPCRLETLAPGDFAIFFPPCGAHAPCLSRDGAVKIRKVVVKIHV